MNYLDAMERQGQAADPDKAMDACSTRWKRRQASGNALRDDPAG